MARRTREKTVTRVRKEPPSKPTIGLFRFPRIGRSSHWIIHGAGARTVSHTAHSLSTHVLHHARVHHPITRTHTLARTGRLNGYFSLRDTRAPPTVSHRHAKRGKKGENYDAATWHTCRHIFTRDDTRCRATFSIPLSFSFFHGSIFWKRRISPDDARAWQFIQSGFTCNRLGRKKIKRNKVTA